jgi:hypothetical protein
VLSIGAECAYQFVVSLALNPEELTSLQGRILLMQFVTGLFAEVAL